MLDHCDLLIFDCDGVLVDSEPLAVEAFVQVLTDAGLPATSAMVERCFGMKQADILMRLSQDFGRDIPEEVPRNLWPMTKKTFERALQPMPGVKDVLVRTNRTKRCVASSSNPERIQLSLRLTGLDGFFGDAVFSSHQVAHGKPAPDLFLFAAETMKVEPSRCIVIEDSIYGIQGAVAAGMTAIGFSGGGHILPGHEDELKRYGASTVEATWEGVLHRLTAQPGVHD